MRKINNLSTTIATFTYDGDGRRVKAVENGVSTLFVGAHYEVKGSEITKYYFAGTSRIAMRKYTIPQSMTVEYMLGDHLGSTSITTDNAGTKVSEMRYKPWGEVRYSWTATQSTSPSYEMSNYTFTGQYSYMDDPSTSGVSEGFGLMFYNARWYDPTLGRFAQADTIVPGGSQGLDRYSYTFNNPINFIDPSGHVPADCLGGDGYCQGSSNPLMGCQIHCSRDEIADTSLEERYEWFAWLRGQMDQEINPGTGDWFVNIQTVIEGFYVTGQDANNWILSIDADIIYAVQEGFATYTEGGTPTTRGGAEWRTFFEMAKNNESEEILLHQWGKAEFWGTNDGLFGQAGLPLYKDDINFTLIGTLYRGGQFTVCYAVDCVNGLGGFFNPQTTINGMLSNLSGATVLVPYGDRSPVAIALYSIYVGDYLGAR